jgi:TnpA family transposase
MSRLAKCREFGKRGELASNRKEEQGVDTGGLA